MCICIVLVHYQEKGADWDKHRRSQEFCKGEAPKSFSILPVPAIQSPHIGTFDMNTEEKKNFKLRGGGGGGGQLLSFSYKKCSNCCI